MAHYWVVLFGNYVYSDIRQIWLGSKVPGSEIIDLEA